MTAKNDITLNDILPLTKLYSLIKIQHGSKTIFCGDIERLEEELDNKYYEKPIQNIGSCPVIYHGLTYSAIYIYFRG